MQTSYAEMPVAFAGMKADASDDQVDSYAQGEASAEIPFGVMVCQGTAGGTSGTPDKAILPVDANSVPVGVVVHSHDYDSRTELGTTGLKPKTMLSVMRRGRIWVQVEDAVTVNAPAFYRYTSDGGSNTQVGKFRSDADSAKALKVRGAIYKTAASAGGFAILELDMLTERAVRGVTGY